MCSLLTPLKKRRSSRPRRQNTKALEGASQIVV